MRWLSEPRHGAGIDARGTMYPTEMSVLVGEGNHTNLGDMYGTTYGVVVKGGVVVEKRTSERQESFTLYEGSYFSVPCSFNMGLIPKRGGDDAQCQTVLITKLGFLGQTVTGRLEGRGRLSYVDGCSDSLLVYPPRMGDPCLNHLHFPGDVLQTQHTHPSIRMGVVMGGEGVSWRGKNGEKADLRSFMDLVQDFSLDTAVKLYESYAHLAGSGDSPISVVSANDGSDSINRFDNSWPEFENIDMLHHLRPGGVFLLEEGELHSFATPPGGHMEIVAFHPDSDWGPTDNDHPMLNRTYIKHGQ